MTSPDPDPAPFAQPLEPARPPVGRRRKLLIATALVVVIVLAGGAVAAYLLSNRSTSPKPVAKAFAVAMATGDAAGLAANSVGDEASLTAVVAEANKNAAHERVVAAARKKFGDEKLVLPGPQAKDAWGNRAAHIDEAAVEFRGTEAVVGDVPMVLAGGQWKVDRGRLLPPGDPLLYVPMTDALRRVNDEVAAGIEGGKYATAEAAKIALGAGTRAAVKAMIDGDEKPPASRPATTGPATAPTR